MNRPPRISPLFPYTTLFRSEIAEGFSSGVWSAPALRFGVRLQERGFQTLPAQSGGDSMGKDGDSRGLVSKEYLDRFAELFERSEYAKDPNSREARESESDFNSLLDQVYSTEVEPRCP